MIYDCFSYWDEDLLLDLRLNILDNYVDYFVIVEGNKTWQNNPKKLRFEIDKFKKFKNKIIYVPVTDLPDGVDPYLRENHQRNCISRGLKNAKDDDLIIISDLDEIPNLENINFKNIKNKLILFKQKMFYYKFNLLLDNMNWCGSKSCKKKDLLTPQWLREIKDKKYPLWRIDTLFSNTKASDIFFVDKGGWHFSNMKTPKEIEKKMRTYLHHREYDLKPLGTKKIEEIIKSKKSIYNLRADMKNEKIDGTQNLKATDGRELPEYLKKNKTKYSNWIE